MSQALAGDEHMGKFVYCKSHVGPHSTGWCTVGPGNKIALKAQSRDDAYAEVRSMNLPIFGKKSLGEKPEDS